jgi:hypothetical protein
MESCPDKVHVGRYSKRRVSTCLLPHKVSTLCTCHVLGSDRSDRLASPSKNKNYELPSSSLHCNTSATASCCLKTKHIVKSFYAFFQLTNPRNVLFCNVAQPVTRAPVSAVACPPWRDITQAVGFYYELLRNSFAETEVELAVPLEFTSRLKVYFFNPRNICDMTPSMSRWRAEGSCEWDRGRGHGNRPNATNFIVV